jgi:hypothetical protein
VITLITGTISRSDFKRLFVTFQTELSSDNAPIATLSVIDQAVGPSCPLVPLCNRITSYTTANLNIQSNVAIKLCVNCTYCYGAFALDAFVYEETGKANGKFYPRIHREGPEGK